MASRRERILQAVNAALDAPSVTIDAVVHARPAGLRVHRQRRRSIEADRLPATVVYLLEEDVDLDTHEPTTRRTALVRLEHRAVGEPEDEALDPLVTWGTRALLADAALDELVVGIEEVKIQWAGEFAGENFGGAAQDFEIEYETPEDDPEG